MKTASIKYARKELQSQKIISQQKWQRITLLSVLGYEAAGCLLGGSLLVAAPDGRFMNMPVDIMHGSFHDFLIPGIILFGLGILTTIAFFSVLGRIRNDWFMACFALGALLIWFWIEIAILQELHWLHAMWGLPVVLGAVVAVPLIPAWRNAVVKAALVCGILSSVLFIVVNIIVPLQYPGYNSASQVPSELSAIGAPTQMLWSVLATPYTFLMLAFAWGIWKSAGENRRLRSAGVFMLAYGALGFLWPFAPMNQREVLAAGGGTFSDTMHIVLGAATEIFYLLALGFAATALGKTFRIYSIITFVILLVFGVLTFIDSPGVAKNLPTPFIGVWERINIGVFLLWVIVLAVILLKREKNADSLTAAN
ncbi:MAG: DUF998 domain-containing protein [Sphingobacteriales bacterium]